MLTISNERLLAGRIPWKTSKPCATNAIAEKQEEANNAGNQPTRKFG
jgi:hypothetical protein